MKSLLKHLIHAPVYIHHLANYNLQIFCVGRALVAKSDPLDVTVPID